MDTSASEKELMKIPGVGRSIARDLIQIGVYSVGDLEGKDPEVLYQLSNAKRGYIQDRCLLYVFKCAVYYASTPNHLHEGDKLKWWNWK